MEGTICHQGICSKCWAVKYIIMGTIFVLTLVWSGKEDPVRALYNLFMVVGVLMVFKGLLIMTNPMGCGHCQSQAEAKKSKR